MVRRGDEYGYIDRETMEFVVTGKAPATKKPRSYVIWACPVCGKKHPGQGAHRTAGEDRATGCFHDGEPQPRLIKLRVVPEDKPARSAHFAAHLLGAAAIARRHATNAAYRFWTTEHVLDSEEAIDEFHDEKRRVLSAADAAEEEYRRSLEAYERHVKAGDVETIEPDVGGGPGG